MRKVIVMVVVLAFCFTGLALCQIKDKSEIVGLWKTDLILPEGGKEWISPPTASSYEFLPTGKFIFLSPIDKPAVRISGNWRILKDGKLDLDEKIEENLVEKTRHFLENSFSTWTFRDARLVQPQIMLRKVK